MIYIVKEPLILHGDQVEPYLHNLICGCPSVPAGGWFTCLGKFRGPDNRQHPTSPYCKREILSLPGMTVNSGTSVNREKEDQQRRQEFLALVSVLLQELCG